MDRQTDRKKTLVSQFNSAPWEAVLCITDTQRKATSVSVLGDGDRVCLRSECDSVHIIRISASPKTCVSVDE